MDIAKGSPAREAFVTNVGLITSNGPHGPNIMAAEWTFQISYDPSLIAVSVGPKKATHDNIVSSKCFGVTIADVNQNILASLAGGYSAREIEKIAFLQELGFVFRKAEHMDVWMPEGGMMQAECALVDQKIQGDHVVFIGRTLSVSADPTKHPLVYHRGQYWGIGEHVPKPSPEEREMTRQIAEKHRKI